MPWEEKGKIKRKIKGTDHSTDVTHLHKPILPPSPLNFPLHLFADLHQGRPVAHGATIAFIAGNLVDGVAEEKCNCGKNSTFIYPSSFTALQA